MATVVLEKPGTYVLAMERSFSFIELSAKDFNNYLQHEGLDTILKQRSVSGTDTASVRERYARAVKALIQVGNTIDNTATRVLGEMIEIVPEQNPYTLQLGNKFSCRVLFDGKPLLNKQVKAYVKSDGIVRSQTANTDANGRVSFLLDSAGVWMIRLVHIQECQDKSVADWESWWTSLTFAIRE